MCNITKEQARIEAIGSMINALDKTDSRKYWGYRLEQEILINNFYQCVFKDPSSNNRIACTIFNLNDKLEPVFIDIKDYAKAVKSN